MQGRRHVYLPSATFVSLLVSFLAALVMLLLDVDHIKAYNDHYAA